MVMTKLKEQNLANYNENHLYPLYHWLLQQNDTENASKILDLYEKMKNDEFIVGFTGHFSAGKSSMINALLGREILPKSPIPTSANIVKIKSGAGLVRLFLEQGDIIEINEPYDAEKIKQYSAAKGIIRSIEIEKSDFPLPAGAVIMDTPGVDAADDADGKLTSSALHMADVLFYMMDYNHVQSEVNLFFLKEIQEMGIPFFIIVNQIDKHNEKELSFSQFTETIQGTFQNWELKPERIFYSSLLEGNYPYNEFPEIKSTLLSLFQEKEDRMRDGFQRAVEQIVRSHKKFIELQFEEKIKPLEIHGVGPTDEEWDSIQNKLQRLEEQPLQLEKEFRHEIEYTLANAYIMPASLREIIHSYLESMDGSFKVGLFASKKKTKHEREKRLEAFYEALKKNVESLIQWKLRDKVLHLLKKYEIDDDQLYQQVQSFSVPFSKDRLRDHVKPGAKLNGDYVLHYADDVANDIKRQYKQKIMEILPSLIQYIAEANEGKMTEWKERLSQIEKQRFTAEKKEELEQERQECIAEFHEILHSPNGDDHVKQHLKEAYLQKYARLRTEEAVSWEKPERKADEVPVSGGGAAANKANGLPLEQVIKSIDAILSSLGDTKVVHHYAEELQEKRQSLKNRSYTIALFGAFSAGKSSFINALIGDDLLPVSPNPTTAAVNRIRPVTEQYGHNTVVLTLKTKENIANDIVQMTKKFSPPSNELGTLLDWIARENIHIHPDLNEMYQAYLQALLRGWPDYQREENREKIISIDELKLYVTDEAKACYLEIADVYFDCPLTKQGITLVDTPGADSMNARHTNVAFNYIKHADALLYVTYFNHAFSRADRDFLKQLGRVKDAFQLDKMFFLINASDLAENKDELKLVIQYVEEQLQAFGIRLPRLYPISSKNSLLEKQRKIPLNEEMANFEAAFYRFIHQDLTALTVQSAIREMKRIHDALEEYIASIQLDESEKQKRIQSLTEKKDKLTETISAFETAIYEKNIRDKVEKQLHYVLERLSIRFHDLFKDSFNPTTVTESGKKAHEQLRKNTEQLLEYVSFELHQEIQAVTLRVEAFLTEQAEHLYQRLGSYAENIDRLFTLYDWKRKNWNTPTIERGLENIDIALFDQALKKYKGTKSFFVHNEKERMKEELFALLSPFAEQYVRANQTQISEAYLSQWNRNTEAMKKEMMATIRKTLENYRAMIGSEVNLSQFQNSLEIIQKELQNNRIEDM